MKVQTNPNLTTDLSPNELPIAAHPNDTLDARVKAMIQTTKYVISALESADDVWASDSFVFL
jgi:hypothetical protein